MAVLTRQTETILVEDLTPDLASSSYPVTIKDVQGTTIGRGTWEDESPS
jgi:hypothetical protein